MRRACVSVLWSLVGTAAVALVACSSGSSDHGGIGTSFQALCVSSCPRGCSQDTDCTGQGQLCCDFGGGSKACVAPQNCPHFCQQDSDCSTDQGQSCCAANAESKQKVCAPTASCQHACSTDRDCSGGTPKCCTDFSQPFCTAVNECPTTCQQSSACNTQAGDACCTTLGPILKSSELELAPGVAGLCLQASVCPKACKQSTDCDTTKGQLCCNGYCSDQGQCTKSCKSDQDCPTDQGELCCTNSAIGSPWWGWTPPQVTSNDGGVSNSDF